MGRQFFAPSVKYYVGSDFFEADTAAMHAGTIAEAPTESRLKLVNSHHLACLEIGCGAGQHSKPERSGRC
jgi:hypothetical protein